MRFDSLSALGRGLLTSAAIRKEAGQETAFQRVTERRGLYRLESEKVSPLLPHRRPLPVVPVGATVTALLLASSLGCSPRKPERDPRPQAVPVVEESYAIDDVNRPLKRGELDDAFARLQSDEAGFIADLEQAPPVRQASLIFVLQRTPSVAREHRALLEKLSASEHGIVRRAALFALEAAEEGE